MHILISYADGTHETVSVSLEGDVVSEMSSLIPGHLADEPVRCSRNAEFFNAAIDEGGERSGTESGAFPEPEPGMPEPQAFRWELVGSEEDECRVKLRRWTGILGPALDPWLNADDYQNADGSLVLSAEQAGSYRRDMRCCLHYLDDPIDVPAIVRDGDPLVSEAPAPGR